MGLILGIILFLIEILGISAFVLFKNGHYLYFANEIGYALIASIILVALVIAMILFLFLRDRNKKSLSIFNLCILPLLATGIYFQFVSRETNTKESLSNNCELLISNEINYNSSKIYLKNPNNNFLYSFVDEIKADNYLPLKENNYKITEYSDAKYIDISFEDKDGNTLHKYYQFKDNNYEKISSLIDLLN